LPHVHIIDFMLVIYPTQADGGLFSAGRAKYIITNLRSEMSASTETIVSGIIFSKAILCIKFAFWRNFLSGLRAKKGQNISEWGKLREVIFQS
jgi:uncharacterized protein (DUF3084 family)